MDFTVKFFSFVVLATICFADLNYKIISYLNQELVTKENPFANVEVHCFHLDHDNVPIYVRGTYGQRGYFEGPIDDGTASVNYIEIGYSNENGLTPSVGTGILEYNTTYNVANGTKSNSEDGDLSYWKITTNNDYFGAPLELTDAQIAEQYCFWDITDTDGSAPDQIHFKPWWVLSTTDPNPWYTLNLRKTSFRGSIRGAYRYTYSTEDCNKLYEGCKEGHVEWGIYSHDTAYLSFNSSLVLATEWKATSGPLSGESGSALIALVAGADRDAKQIGFFCNSERNVDYPSLSSKKILTSCFFDSSTHEQPDTKPDTATNRIVSWWHNLSVLINTIFETEQGDSAIEG
eukprot:gene8104-8763_t